MEQFAKIFEVNNTHQILCTKDFDDDDEVFQVKSEIQHEGVSVAMSIGFKTEQSRDHFFNKYGQDHADDAFNRFQSVLELK